MSTPTLDAYVPMLREQMAQHRWKMRLARGSLRFKMRDWWKLRQDESYATLDACLAARDEAIRIRARAEAREEMKRGLAESLIQGLKEFKEKIKTLEFPRTDRKPKSLAQQYVESVCRI